MDTRPDFTAYHSHCLDSSYMCIDFSIVVVVCYVHRLIDYGSVHISIYVCKLTNCGITLCEETCRLW